MRKAGSIFISVSLIFVLMVLLLLSLATGGEKTEPTILLVNANIPLNYQKVNVGGSLLVQTEIIFIKQEYKDVATDVHIEYLIRDSSRKTITTVSETKGVIDRIFTVKELMLPSDTRPGVYTIEVKAEYQGLTSNEAASFEVMKSPSSPSPLINREVIPLLATILILFMIFLVALYYEHRRIKRLEREGYRRI